MTFALNSAVSEVFIITNIIYNDENSTKSLFSQSDMLCACGLAVMMEGVWLRREGVVKAKVGVSNSVTNTHRVHPESSFTD